MKKLILLIALGIMLLGILSCSKKQETIQKPIRIAVEFTTHSACAHIANQMGWYEEEGLNITSYESYIPGMALAAALAKGDIDAAYICLIPAINARANAHLPIKIVAGIHKYGYGFVVNQCCNFPSHYIINFQAYIFSFRN